MDKDKELYQRPHPKILSLKGLLAYKYISKEVYVRIRELMEENDKIK